MNQTKPLSAFGLIATATLILASLVALLSHVAMVERAKLRPAEEPPLAQQQVGPQNADARPPAFAPTADHFGYTPNPEATKQFLQSLPRPMLRDYGPDLFRDGEDRRPVLLYRALYKAYKARFGRDWKVGTQGIGDCVSWGWAHGIEHHMAVQLLLGHTAEWRPVATEAIYGGSRVEARGGRLGGYSDGSYGAAAGKFVRDWGVLFRQRYESIDLTTYSASLAKNWGNFGCGGQGDNGYLDEVCRQHPVKTVALVTTFSEAAAAIRSGYPVPVCSGVGFTNHRDQDGFAHRQGSWPHCMCFVGVRFEPRPGLLCLNSWGTQWINGAKWPEDQPDGSFWVDANVVNQMLAGQDSFAVSGFVGFPFRKLNHGDWVRVEKVYGPEEAEPLFALAP